MFNKKYGLKLGEFNSTTGTEKVKQEYFCFFFQCFLVNIYKGQTLTEESLTDPDMRLFWETITTSVIPVDQGGHVDLFVPLTETGK